MGGGRFLEKIEKGLGGRVEAFLLAVYDTERAVKSGLGKRDGAEPAVGQFRLKDARRHDAYAGTEDNRFFDGLDVIEVHRRIHFDAMRPEVSRDFPADG